MSNNRAYGTTTNGGNDAGANGTTNTNATERNSLLAKQTKNEGNRLREHLNADVSKNKADLILLFSYITTGLLDSTATAVWGSFVSMQTGNTVYVGLGIADPHASARWIKSGTSILAFCFGSFVFARWHRAFSQRRRWVMLVSVLVQLLCIIGAAVIVTVHPNDEKSPAQSKRAPWYVLIPVALVAFQSAGQAVISRALQFNALTSVVLTSIYCDLFMDARLFAGLTENVERNRRTAAPVLLLLGAVLGGLWSRSEIGIAGALWTAALMKVIVIAAWGIWPAEKAVSNSRDNA